METTCERVGGQEVYRISIPGVEEDSVEVNWLYSPLNHTSVLLDRSGFSDLLRFANGGEASAEIRNCWRQLCGNAHAGGASGQAEDDKPVCPWNRLIIIPNDTCNFSCQYCYSAKGRSNRRLDIDVCRAAIEDFCRRTEGAESLRIGYLGGGEPCLTRGVLFKSAAHAKVCAERSNRRLQLDISTNGSVMDDEMISFFCRYDVNVGVSFDILEDVQESQRSHYELVAGNIRRALDAGVRVLVKSTVTPMSVDRMVDAVECVADGFPGLRSVYFQTVIDPDAIRDEFELRRYNESYRKNFFSARMIGRARGVHVEDTLVTHAGMLVDRFCPGEYCLTPEGTITACDFVTTDDAPFVEDFKYGRVDETGTVRLDLGRLRTILRMCMGNRSECEACFAKHHCAGGCAYRGRCLSESMKREQCAFMKSFIAQDLFSRFYDGMSAQARTELRTYFETLGIGGVLDEF